MNKFKAGDKVRVVDATWINALHEGEIHTVKNVHDYYVYVGTSPDGWDESRFELVVPTFKKGDRVVRTGPHTLAGGVTNFADRECKVGEVGTVDQISTTGNVIVRWDKGNVSAIISSSLSAYVEPKFKVGDRVVVTVGDRVVVTKECVYGSSKWGKFGTVTRADEEPHISYPIQVRLDDETYDGSLYTESEIRLVEVKTTKKKAIQVQAHFEGGDYPDGRAENVTNLFTEFLKDQGYKIRGKVTTDIYEYTQKTEV